MRKMDPTDLIPALLEQGLTVCYIDQDDRRRARARRIGSEWGDGKMLLDLFGVSLAQSIMHYDVTIAVNPPPRVGGPIPSTTANRWTDWLAISATNITVETP